MGANDQTKINDRPDTKWQLLTLQNGWTASLFYRVKDGVVYFKNRIQAGTLTNGTVITNLPLVARPPELRELEVLANASYHSPSVEIATNGDITINDLAGGTYLIMDNVHYHL